MSDDFYPFVDSGDPAPDNAHITGTADGRTDTNEVTSPDEATCSYACRIAVYDDMLSTPRVLVIAPQDVRTYLEEITNTVYRCMKEQGGGISLMVIREIVENFIHAHFVEPIISILDDGNTIRFADQGPGIEDKERAFEFGVTSADRDQKRYIRGTGAGFPMVQQYLENAGGAISIEDNLHQGTVVTVSIDPRRVDEIEQSRQRGGAVRGAIPEPAAPMTQQGPWNTQPGMQPETAGVWQQASAQQAPYQQQGGMPQQGYAPAGYPAAPGTAAGAPQGWNPYGAQPQPYGAPWPQQPWGYPGAAWGQMPQQPYQAGMQQPGWQQMPGAGGGSHHPHVSERGAMALGFLAQHGSCGPTDLQQAFGSSTPTWSRELEALANAGLVVKRGQKRFLTEMGTIFINEQ